MKTNHKLILLGLTIDVLAGLSAASAAKSSLKPQMSMPNHAGFWMDPQLFKLAMQQQSQSMALLSLAGKGMALYGLHMTHPKLAIGLGVAYVGIGAVPAVIGMIDPKGWKQAQQRFAHPPPPPVMAPPPMVDDEHGYTYGGMYEDAMW